MNYSKTSKLDDAIENHMNYIVHTEYRPFCYYDFLSFEVDGKKYRMTHGTFRNKVSRLIKAGKVELEYYSRLAFYTIKGVHFGRRKHNPARMMMMTQQPMTPYHMGDNHLSSDCHKCHQQKQQQQKRKQEQTRDSGDGSSTYHGHAGTASTTTTAAY